MAKLPEGFLRATRNCFYFSELLNAYVRMSWMDEKKGDLKVEICPAKDIVEYCRYQNPGEEHLRWHEPPEEKQEAITQLNLPQENYSSLEVVTVNVGAEK